MPRHTGVNTKALEAIQRKKEQKELIAKKKEAEMLDKLWEDNDKLAKAKQERKLDQQRKQQEKLQKKMELKKLLQEEESQLISNKMSKGSVTVPKITRAECLRLQLLSQQNLEKEIVKQDVSLKNTRCYPPEVTTTASLASTIGLADSSSNYLSLKSKATPRDRGGDESVEDWTSSGPVADLREAEGEVNREAVCKTNGGLTLGGEDTVVHTEYLPTDNGLLRLNTNHQLMEERLELEKKDIELIDATGLDDALNALSIDKDPKLDKSVKALYMSFQERKMVELREEYPNLKLSQYKDMVFKLWKKSPENPMNNV